MSRHAKEDAACACDLLTLDSFCIVTACIVTHRFHCTWNPSFVSFLLSHWRLTSSIDTSGFMTCRGSKFSCTKFRLSRRRENFVLCMRREDTTQGVPLLDGEWTHTVFSRSIVFIYEEHDSFAVNDVNCPTVSYCVIKL